MSIKVIKDKCTGCMICTRVCPFAAIKVIEKLAVIDLDKCTICGACKEVCNFAAIDIQKNPKKTQDIEKYKGVWIFAEQKRGNIQSISYELLGKATELAQKLGVEVSCMLLGHNITDKAQELISRGADNVYVVDSPELEHFLDEPYSKILINLIRKKELHLLR